MKKSIICNLKKNKKRYLELEKILSDSSTFKNKKKFKNFSKEYKKLSNLNFLFEKWKKIKKTISSTKDLLKDRDLSEIAEEEISFFNGKKKRIEKKIIFLLTPEDPVDKRSCFIEIRAATGGDEAAIFSKDLFKMYMRYAELKKWKVKIISMNEREKGGFKEVIVKISGKDVFGRLKFESGGHRVQRVPITESQGRLHTSTCTVAILPELPKIERIEINSADLKIDTFRASGAGGQHVNTTDSAIRITHIPTNTVVECQDERSQHKNKEKALSVLSSRIYTAEQNKLNSKNAVMRRNLLGSGERSDRKRTYNYPQNRITDHRINLTVYCLDKVLQGELDILIDPIIDEYRMNSIIL